MDKNKRNNHKKDKYSKIYNIKNDFNKDININNILKNRIFSSESRFRNNNKNSYENNGKKINSNLKIHNDTKNKSKEKKPLINKNDNDNLFRNKSVDYRHKKSNKETNNFKKQEEIKSQYINILGNEYPKKVKRNNNKIDNSKYHSENKNKLIYFNKRNNFNYFNTKNKELKTISKNYQQIHENKTKNYTKKFNNIKLEEQKKEKRKDKIFKKDNKKNNEKIVANKIEVMEENKIEIKEEKAEDNKKEILRGNLFKEFENVKKNNDEEIKEQNPIKEKNEQFKLNEEYQSKLDEYINIIKNLKEKIKDIQEEKKSFNLLEKEKLNKRICEMQEKENEYNKKLVFLEDKENQIEIEKQELENNKDELKNINEENKKLKQENQNLILVNKKLEKELNKFRIKYEKDLKNNPIFLYETPTLIGLNNIGATCFMNATLQCLSQIKDLTNYFLNEKNKNNIINNNISMVNKNANQLSPVYLELIHNLWDINGNKVFGPYNFMNKINEMNPLFKKGQAGDSKDFIIYILEQLHKELKKPLNSNNINNLSLNEPLNQYDKNNAFNHFFNDFQKECSIISDIFFGITETTNECQNCKNNYNAQGLNNPIVYNYQIFNCLIFPLEEVKNWKNNNTIQNYNFNEMNNIISLIDALNIIKNLNFSPGIIKIIVMFANNYLTLFFLLKYI